MKELEYVTLKKLAQDTGYTEAALRRKIERGTFVEGIHYVKAPDGRIHFNLEAYQKWLRKEPIQASKGGAIASVLNFSGRDSDAAKH